MSGTRTTCPYCGVDCGIVARVERDAVNVSGDPDHPANLRRLCSKGAALGETVGLEDRLLTPLVNGKRTSWDVAIAHVASGFAQTIAEHGPDSVAFYVSGQLLTEDYYVVNKLAKGFIGTANIDTNSRLCMASSVAGHKRAFGADVVPGAYEDLEQADLVVFVGSNAAWCHPVLYQRIAAAKEKRPQMRVVLIDPRRTETAALADLHLPLRPGSDAVLFNGLLNHLSESGAIDADFVERHTSGAAAALAAAQPYGVERVAEDCGLPVGVVAMFFDWFARTERTATLYSQGINQSSSGVDKVNAILNCHLFTGRIGRPGLGPFSLTGQPNAMGGREVGGLANQLAAHMELGDPAQRELVQRFWNAPRMAEKPGLKAVGLFEAIGAGRVKALWIMATNPLVSLPDADRAREALGKCPLVVVSDCVASNDTLKLAHITLPATTWGEKDGTVTNSERCISRQRRFLDPPGEARDDWRIVADVAKAMGFDGFNYAMSADVFREHAALSGYENAGARAFDISALQDVSEADYDALAPFQWPMRRGGDGPKARLFGQGGFLHPDGRARLIAIEPRPPVGRTDAAWPLVLNTGRVRDHWHTMTRTARAARLSGHVFEPYAELHPADARRYGVVDGELAEVASERGRMIARVRVSAEQRRGCVFAPMHWSDEFAAAGRVNALVAPHVDPISGQPESKQTPVSIAPYAAVWRAFLLTRERGATPREDYWALGRGVEHWRIELAGVFTPPSWDERARAWLGEQGEWITYRDAAAGRYRFARIFEGRLEGCLFVAPDLALPSRSWLGGLFGARELTSSDRQTLLAGRPLNKSADVGPIVCACFGIGQNQIDAVISGGAASVEAVGARVKAGTNCGSCKSEIAKRLRPATVAA